jgi:hypothetical protein
MPFGDVHCHFFEEKRIELDFVPTDISTACDFDQLLALLRLLAGAVSKPVFVSQENWPENRLFTFVPDADEFVQGDWWLDDESRSRDHSATVEGNATAKPHRDDR